MRPRSSLLALAAALAVGITGCNDRPARPVAAPVVATPTPDAVPTVEPTPSVQPAPSLSPSASPSPTKSPKPTYDVKAVQQSLTSLRYYVGPVDGVPGRALRSAVMAFQKVQGIGADGTIGTTTLAALSAPKPPVLKATSPADRVEIDLTKQVLYVVTAGKIDRIMPVSSGNGKTYLQKDGAKARALTPVGWYKIERRIIGVREADLGTLYDPQYFYKGWAIHGSNSVPARPASHGCVRVTRTDATWLLDKINVGTHVFLYGGEYTFPAGSSAPGTDAPTGDTPKDAPATSPTPSARPSATQSPARPPAPTEPSPSPEPSTVPTAAPSSTPRPS